MRNRWIFHRLCQLPRHFVAMQYTRSLTAFAMVVLSPLSIAFIGLLSMAASVKSEEVAEQPAFSPEEIEFFETRIRPVLVENCQECHSRAAKSIKGNLLLDDREGLLKGGDSGAAIVPGDPAASLLIEAVNYDGLEMPPKGKLPERVLLDLERWVAIGAPWPHEPQATQTTTLANRIVDETMISDARRTYWAFQPVVQHPLPPVGNISWPRTRIDYFVLHQLDVQGMSPAQQADKRTLIRRVYFDLIGLLPDFESIEKFLEDDSPLAYENLIDRLLASPQYGERWGRYWLDVVRYAEDHPNGALPPRFPHRYRDWVIGALNDNLPYDEFVRRQLAADSLALPADELAALGFLGLSPSYVIDEKFADEIVRTIVADEWDERVDVVSRGLLGLTVACARCHDHKFDPITSRDYYALAGVMANTQMVEEPLTAMFDEDAAYIAALTEDLRFHEKRYTSRYNQRQGLIRDKEPDIFRYDKEILESASEIQRIKSLLPENYESIPRVNAVRDAATYVNPEFYVVRELVSPEAKFWRKVEFDAENIRDLRIHIRGSVSQLGDLVPRRFVSVLTREDSPPFRQGSGRRELADAIVREAASLTGRVIVNRVWSWHFGHGLVRTPSNFGELGERPSHPELLDDLTARFIEGGWSLKELHREILLSATYRQAAIVNATYTANDPDNVALWRMNRRRMDVESWRDTMLEIAGELETTMGGKSFELSEDGKRRTIYGKVSRSQLADVLQLFDFPEATRHSEDRSITTTALQQLYFMNSPFIQQRAAAVVEHFGASSSPIDSARAIYRRVLGRNPSSQDVALVNEMILHDSSLDDRGRLEMLAQALLCSNELMFVD